MIRQQLHRVLLSVMLLIGGCGGSKEKAEEVSSKAAPAHPPVAASPTPLPTPSALDLGGGLTGLVLHPGQGTARVLAGDAVELRVRLLSRDRQEIWAGELEHKAGQPGGFPGLDRAVDGMKLGEVRELNVPADLAFKPPEANAPADVILVVEVTKLKEENKR